MFTAALLTVAKARKHGQMNGWRVAHVCRGLLLSHKKEGSPAVGSSMVGTVLSEVSQRKTNTI